MKTFYAKDRNAWRAWLRKNSKSANEIWLVFYKKNSGKRSISFSDALDEALCFGWIDALVRSIDQSRYAQRFVPRKPTSSWSSINIERAKYLINEGRMTPAGMKAFGNHELRKTQPHPAALPRSLERKFKADRRAWNNFQALPQGYKRMTIGWVASAKNEETQTKRLGKLIEFSARNERIKFI